MLFDDTIILYQHSLILLFTPNRIISTLFDFLLFTPNRHLFFSPRLQKKPNESIVLLVKSSHRLVRTPKNRVCFSLFPIPSRMRTKSVVAAGFFLLLILTTSRGFQSDELLADDEEFGLEGGIRSRSRSDPNNVNSATPQSTRKRLVPDSDSKIQFPLEHAFGDSDFSPAGTFTARLKSSSHGSQVFSLNNCLLINYFLLKLSYDCLPNGNQQYHFFWVTVSLIVII